MITFPDWLIEVYRDDVLEAIVRRVCHDRGLAGRIEDEVRERLIDMAAEERLPEVRRAGFALLKSILGHVLVDSLRRRHVEPVDLAGEAIDALGAREPADGEPERTWEVCEADLFPWARERSDALASELTPGMLRMLALPDGLSDEAAAARLALPLKQLLRDKCRLLLRLAEARLRSEPPAGDLPAPEPGRPSAPTARRGRRRKARGRRAPPSG